MIPKEKDNKNLAIVTECFLEVDASSGNVSQDCGLTANLKANTEYHVSFDMEMIFTHSYAAGRVMLGSYHYWAWYGRFFNGTITEPYQTVRHVDQITRCNDNTMGDDPSLFVWIVNNQKGTLKITNLVITEV